MKNILFKLFWLIFVVVLGVISFRIYQIYKERNIQAIKSNQANEVVSSNSSSLVSNQNSASTNSSSVVSPDSITSSDNTSTSDSASASSQTKATDVAPSVGVNDKNSGDGNMFAHITTEHCDTGCKAFANKLNFLEYCQQVCGLVPIKKVKNCDNKKDLEKDYCNKDLAITKKDVSLCANIKDANIQQTCQNRIMQDIIENQ
jgi:hypothetical protein